MKIKEFFKKNWCYVVAFLIPWMLIVIHGFVRRSWLTGEGSILAGDAGTLYYTLYTELWNKVHEGETLLYTWNIGLGTDFLANIFRYLMSPFTLLVLMVPKAWLSDVTQLFMVLKWSLGAVTLTYFFRNTRHNVLGKHKTWMSLALAMCIFLGNGVLMNLSVLNGADTWIWLPLVLLWTEYTMRGKGYKRLFVGFTMLLICDIQGAPVMLAFVVIWWMLQVNAEEKTERKRIWKSGICILSGAIAGLGVLIPVWNYFHMESEGGKAGITIPLNALAHRFFFGDALGFDNGYQPMLYMSVVGLALCVLYFAIKRPLKEKLGILAYLVFLFLGICIEKIGTVYNMNFVDSGCRYSQLAFLLAFVLVYMLMQVLCHMEQLRIWQLGLVFVAGVAVMAYTFLHTKTFVEAYAYIGTFLLFVLILLLMVFFCRKSIRYGSMLLVVSVLCVGELLANGYLQLEEYNMYPIQSMYYHSQSEKLLDGMTVEPGQRLGATQTMENFGSVWKLPTAGGQTKCSDGKMNNVFGALGLATNEDAYSYFGGSPLLNCLLQVKYGIGTSDISFSDGEELKNQAGLKLYEMNQENAAGYVVDASVLDLSVEQGHPFDLQNNLAQCITGEKTDIFHTVIPDEFVCKSLLGGERLHEARDHENGEESHEGHVHSDDPNTVVEYDLKSRQYTYTYRKMYNQDIVTASFLSDGVSDYYIYVNSDAAAYYNVAIGESMLYQDQLATKQKTFHIGVVEKGTVIAVQANALVDDISDNTLYYEVAALDRNAFEKVEASLLENSGTVETWKDGKGKYRVFAGKDGVFLTSIPASKGFHVTVDGKEEIPKTALDGLLAVPVTKGEHTIEISYGTKGLLTGGICFGVGVILMIFGMQMFKNDRK